MTEGELKDIISILQSDDNKMILIKKIVSLESKRLNISPPSVRLFSDANTNHRGRYDPQLDIVFINKEKKINSQDDYVRFLNTIIHETRHKYQMAVIKSPNDHSEAGEDIRAYLHDATKNYPERGKSDYWEKYQKNALEHDTKSFAKARAFFYKDFSWYQLMSLQKAPGIYVKNQILVDPGDDGMDGQIAPVSVKEPYYSSFRGTKPLKKELASNENTLYMNEKSSSREDFLRRIHVDVTPITREKNSTGDAESPSISSREKMRARQAGFDRDDDSTYMEKATIKGNELRTNNTEMEGIMSYRMDFTDRNITQVYLDLSEEVKNAYQAFIESTREICVMHAYKPMVDFTNAMQEKYHGDFKECILRLYKEWRDSESSLEALAKRTGAGEEAVQTARTYMDELENNLMGMFSQSFDTIKVDLAAPALTEQDILKINNEINGFMQRVENARTNSEQTCSSRADENVLYALIKPVISSTGVTLEGWMKENMNQVIEGSQLYAQGVATVISNMQTTQTSAPIDAAKWGDVNSFM